MAIFRQEEETTQNRSECKRRRRRRNTNISSFTRPVINTWVQIQREQTVFQISSCFCFNLQFVPFNKWPHSLTSTGFCAALRLNLQNWEIDLWYNQVTSTHPNLCPGASCWNGSKARSSSCFGGAMAMTLLNSARRISKTESKRFLFPYSHTLFLSPWQEAIPTQTQSEKPPLLLPLPLPPFSQRGVCTQRSLSYDGRKRERLDKRETRIHQSPNYTISFCRDSRPINYSTHKKIKKNKKCFLSFFEAKLHFTFLFSICNHGNPAKIYCWRISPRLSAWNFFCWGKGERVVGDALFIACIAWATTSNEATTAVHVWKGRRRRSVGDYFKWKRRRRKEEGGMRTEGLPPSLIPAWI